MFRRLEDPTEEEKDKKKSEVYTSEHVDCNAVQIPGHFGWAATVCRTCSVVYLPFNEQSVALISDQRAKEMKLY